MVDTTASKQNMQTSSPGFIHALLKDFADLYKFRWALYGIVIASLKTRYKRSYLGFFWSLLGPVLNYSVVGYVVLFVGKVTEPNFPTYVLLGSITFHFLSMTASLGGASLIVNESYIKKIYLPKSIFPISVIAIEVVNFTSGFLTLAILLTLFGKTTITPAIFSLPLSFSLAVLFSVGVSNALSVCFVYFRDLQNLVPVIMQVLYYAAPIVYPVSIAPPLVSKLYLYNPYYIYVELIRAPLYKGEMAPFNLYLNAAILSAVSFTFGFYIIKKFENRILFKL